MLNEALNWLVLRSVELVVLGVSEGRLSARLYDQGSAYDITAVPI